MPVVYTPVPVAGRSGTVSRTASGARRVADAHPHADAPRQEHDEDGARRERAEHAEGADQREADRHRAPRAEPGREVGGDRGEEPHAEHGDRAQEPDEGVRGIEVVLDVVDQRPDAHDLRAQREGGEEQPRERGGPRAVRQRPAAFARRRAMRANSSTCLRASRPAAGGLPRADRLEDRDVLLGGVTRLDVGAVERDGDPPLDAERLPALLEHRVPGRLDHLAVERDVVAGRARSGRPSSPRPASRRAPARAPTTSPASRFVASFAASSSSAARTGYTSTSSASPKARTRAPRNGSDSTIRSSSRSRSASRTGAWLVPSSVAMRVSTRRSPGFSSPLAMRCSRTSLTCSRSTVLEIALMTATRLSSPCRLSSSAPRRDWSATRCRRSRS